MNADNLQKDHSTGEKPVLTVVPYQCCPVCNGQGTVICNDFVNSNLYETCKVCDGKMIIPMYIVDCQLSTNK